MKRLQSQTEDSFKIDGKLIGEVVDIQDPKKRDRVKVRVHGIHDPSLPVEDCPWAEQQGVLFGDDYDQVGLSTCPKVGSLVYLSFLFGDPSFPICEGTVRGGDDASPYHTLDGVPDRSIIGPEPASLHDSAFYPHNNVFHTNAGILYLDETPGNERIGIEHKSGSYIEIRPDGTVVYKSATDTYEIIAGKKTVHIEGDLDSTIAGKNQNTISGAYILTASTISLN